MTVRRTPAAAAGWIAVLLALAGGPAGNVPAQDLVRSEDAIVALFSLQTELIIDVKVLERLEDRYERNRDERAAASVRVASIYADLERLFDTYRAARRGTSSAGPVEGDTPVDPEEIPRLERLIDEKEQELMNAERALTGVQDEGRRLRGEVRDRRERMVILIEHIETLRASLPTQREAVTGVWDVTLMPSGDRGVFALFQSGTIVSGQYVIDGPFKGSFEGTLVDRRLLLHRIDERLGRSMDLTAYLSPDGQSLRGTWENYDLANGQARTGAWAGRRRQPRGTTGQDAEPSPGGGGS